MNSEEPLKQGFRVTCKPIFSRKSSYKNHLKTKSLPQSYTNLPTIQKYEVSLTQTIKSLHKSKISELKKTASLKQKALIIKHASKQKKKTEFLTTEEQLHIKLRIYKDFLYSLQISNGIKLIKTDTRYKFFIGPGNNASMVLRVLRTRPWWSSSDTPEGSHLVWTSLKHKPTINSLPYSSRRSFKTTVKPKFKRGLGHGLITDSEDYRALKENEVMSASARMHNRLRRHKQISNKKLLFSNLRSFYFGEGKDLFDVVPMTFHVKSLRDIAFRDFVIHFNRVTSSQNIWIIKPGENSNRGFGINISSDLDEIKQLIADTQHTYIIQKYIENPLLINNRKFDIRCYALVTSINGVIQGYFYKDGYIRTSSFEFNLQYPYDKFVHLTNDAIQKCSDSYGKYEYGNKWSYAELQSYLNENGKNLNLEEEVIPKMKEVITDTIKATYDILDPERKMHSFELFGYDFMIDNDNGVWLIEANTNPCLEQSSYYLSNLIPSLIDNTFRLALDPIFPPPMSNKHMWNWLGRSSIENRFELIFSEAEYVNPS